METGKQIFIGDYLIAGEFAAVGLAEAAHLSAVLMGRSFSDCTVIFSVLLLALFLAALGHGLVRKCLKGIPGRRHKPFWAELGQTERVLYIVYACILLSQLTFIAVSGSVYRQGDMTVETVNSFLETNAVYGVNPMTGQPYTGGIPSRLKILCLPTLYASICRVTGLKAQLVVWRLIPLFTLLSSSAAYNVLAHSLFPENGRKRGCFLVVYGLLLWAENYMFCMDGFGVLSCGFRGVTIRNAVLLPWLLSLLMRKKWLSAACCIVVEGWMVWTLYGLGVCAAVTVGMAAAGLLVGMSASRREAVK